MFSSLGGGKEGGGQHPEEDQEVKKGPSSSQTSSGESGSYGVSGSQGAPHRGALGRDRVKSTRGVRRTMTGFSKKMTSSLHEVSVEWWAQKPEA